MDSIEDIYSNDVYYPFILYCQEHNYDTMADLRRCNFDALARADGITASLLMRIKSLFAVYCKKHPDLLMGSAPKAKPRTPAPVAAGLAERLEDYFKAHADTLIRVTDLCKALAVKRADAVRALENAPWCKVVDATTYFYAPIDKTEE